MRAHPPPADDGGMIRVGINGFGRVGRQVFKVLHSRYGERVEVVAVNDLADAATLAYLLRYDSIHGRFGGTVEPDEHGLVVDGRAVALTNAAEPADIPWDAHAIDLVLEATGRFTRGEEAARHLSWGPSSVIISAPATGRIDGTIVCGVNDHELRPSWRVVSVASCTTNCGALLVKGVHELLTIRRAALTVVHAYTNDQSLHDQPHRELRRGRTAAASLIPASTGSSTDIAKVIPALDGRLASTAIRSPTIDGSLVDLTCEVESRASVAAVNDAFRAMATQLPGVVACTDDPIVSVDVIGCEASVVVDTGLTSVVDDHLVKVFGWFDNEWGYANRCADVIARLACS